MTPWSKYPFIRLVIPLITGIVLCYNILPVILLNLWIPVILTGVLILLPIFWKSFPTYKYRWLTGIFLNVAVLLLGYSLAAATFPQNIPHHFSNMAGLPGYYSAVVSDQPVEKNRTFKVVLQIKEVTFGNASLSSNGKVLCYFKKDSVSIIPKYGDMIIFGKHPAAPSPPGNPGEFNYKSYLEHHGIFHTLVLAGDDFKIVSHDHGNVLKRFALTARIRFLDLLKESGLSSSELPVAAALLAGYDEMLDPGQRNDYAGAGVIHILCVSGLHVGIIYLLAETLFSLLKRRKRIYFLHPVFIIGIIWLYALITGLAAPVLRASIMFTLIILGRSSQKQFNSFNTLAAAAFLLLVFDPPLLFNVGFQLSYTAVLGIISFQPYLRKLWRPKNPVIVYGWDLITVSLAAQILTTPLVLYYFHRFPVYFLFANIVAIPLSGFIIYTGVLFLFISWIPVLGKMALVVMAAGIRLLNNIVAYIDGLPGSVVTNVHLSLFITFILFVLIGFTALYFIKMRKVFLWPVVLCILIISGAAAIRQVRLDNQQMIVFHKASGHPLISLIHERNQVILTDSTLASDISSAGYYLEGLTIEAGLNSHGIRKLSMPCLPKGHYQSSLPEFYTFHGKRLVVLYGNTILPDSGSVLKADYVLLCKNPWTSLNEVHRCFPDARIIADNTCGYRKTDELKDEAAELNTEIYNLREQGALVVDLDE